MSQAVLVEDRRQADPTFYWEEAPNSRNLRRRGLCEGRRTSKEFCNPQEGVRRQSDTRRDLLLARDLQFEMLPTRHPAEAGWDLAARCAPAQTVGGDFYDFFRYANKSISAEAIGDVSGKGPSAAIYAALVVGLLRSVEPLELGPAEMLRTLNKALMKRPVRAKYLSLTYATWNERERVFRIANAGLPYPVIVRNGKSGLLKAGGMPLGRFEDAKYEEHTLPCGPGDLVVFYTDGVTDAMDYNGEYFGSERLEKLVSSNAAETADRVVDAIFCSVACHARGLEAFDDQTVVAVRT
ncbi:MAG: PP2C family protein-serine/threonine phosphatase [Candidatus Acidiferrales bacterium]